MTKRYIYGLIDPDSRCIRYVGCTAKPRKRFLQHCSPISHAPKDEWVRSLKDRGLKPGFVILEVLEHENMWRCDSMANRAERFWIATLLRCNTPLLNQYQRDGDAGELRRDVDKLARGEPLHRSYQL